MRPFFPALRTALLLGVWWSSLFLAHLTHAAPDATPAPESTPKNELTLETVAQRRTALQNEISSIHASLAQLPEGTQQDTALWLTQEIALLERIDAVDAETARNLQHAADLHRESAEVDERTKNRLPPDLDLKPPHNLQLLDQLYAERDYLDEARDWLKADVANAVEALQDAHTVQEEKDRERRATREAAATSANPVKAQRAQRSAELESRLASETVQLREIALHTLRFQQSLLAPKMALLRPNLEWLRNHVSITDEDLAAAKAAREKREAELLAALSNAKAEVDKASLVTVEIERRPTADVSIEELNSRRADRQTATQVVALLTAQREFLNERSKVADLRRRVLDGTAATNEMRLWEKENRARIDRLDRERLLQRGELTKVRRELQDLQERATGDTTDKAHLGPWISDRIQRLLSWQNANTAERAEIQSLRSERLRLQDELTARVGGFTFEDGLEVAQRSVIAGWNYEVFSVQDQPVRVKTVLAVILMVIVGHGLARWLSDFAGGAIFRRFGMNTGQRAAWQTLSFYGLFLIVILAAFNLFHLSLTQFSVVSGALAVGLGFGSQNLLSNFISGIILLIERPVSKGDVIELDGQQLTVEKLGPRSTVVRSRDNIHVIVPNSRLLEQAVTNWTLTDEIVRRKIVIGVAYGSPTRLVDRILCEVMASVEKVKEKPVPSVTFTDFGDNALVFEALFYCEVDDRIEVETELRHRISEAFTRSGITLAFPQRDIHLDTARPLQIEMIAPATAQKSERK